MSNAYVIKNGIIVSKRFVSSVSQVQREADEIVVKPQSVREEEMLRRYSDNNLRIQNLREQIAALDEERVALTQEDAACLAEVKEVFWELSQSRRSDDAIFGGGANALLAGEETRLKLRERIDKLQQDIRNTEALHFRVETTEGSEDIPAKVDSRTKGALSALRNRLSDVRKTLDSGASNQRLFSEANQTLSDCENQLLSLPEKARETLALQMHREEQIRNVTRQTTTGGWRVVQLLEGEADFDNIDLLIRHVSGEKAKIQFTMDGDVNVDYFSGNVGLRENLHRIVLRALISGGAENAVACCREQSPASDAVCRDDNQTHADSAWLEETEQARIATSQPGGVRRR